MTQTQPLPKPDLATGPAATERIRQPVRPGSIWLLGVPLELSPKTVGRYRTWLIIRGLAGLILGGLILFLPGISIEVFALMIGIFLCVIGVARIIIGAADSEFTAGVRVLNVIVGVLLAAIGAIAIRYPGFGLLATVLMVGFAWMMEGGATLALLPPRHQGRGWAIAFAVVSLLAGIILIAWPAAALFPLFIVAGAALLVGGIFDMINGATLKASRATW
jgi:uncharacterized membrane protein HdeD (DUF308 family)